MSLRGRLWSPEGKPLEGGVSLASADPLRTLTRGWSRARTRDGWYRFDGLAPGYYQVHASATSEYRGGHGSIDLTDGRAERRADFVFRPATRILVRLVDRNGTPLRERFAEAPTDIPRHLAILALRDWDGGDLPLTRYAQVLSRDAGYFARLGRDDEQLEEGAFGQMTLEGDPPATIVAAFKHRVLAAQEVREPAPEEVTLTVPFEDIAACLATVRFRVLDPATGAPPEQLSVSLSDLQSSGSLRADAQGVVRAEHVAPGCLGLQAWAPGFAPVHEFIDVEAGADLDLGTIALEEECIVSGRVLVDPGVTDHQLSATLVELDRLRPNESPDTGRRRVIHETGAFRLSIGRGRWAIYVTTDGVAAENGCLVDGRRGPVSGLELPLRRGTPIRVELHDPDHRIRRPVLRLEDDQGIPLPDARSPRVRPGRYTLAVFDGEEPVDREELLVGDAPAVFRVDPFAHEEVPSPPVADQEWTDFLAVRLDEEAAAFDVAPEVPLVDLSGQVRSADGEPVLLANLTLWSGAGHRASSADQSTHWFSFPAVPVGEITLSASASGFRPWQQTLTLAPEPAVQVLDVILQPSVRTVVRLVTPEDRPLSLTAEDRFRDVDVKLTVRPEGTLEEGARYCGVSPRHFFAASTWDVEIFGDPPTVFEIRRNGEDEVLVAARFDEVPPEVRLVLDPARLAKPRCDVRVVVRDGTTGAVILPDAVVLNDPSMYFGDQRMDLETDPDGAVLLRDQETGRRALEVGREGYSSSRRIVELVPGRWNDLETTLHAHARLTFRVVDEAGAPLLATVDLGPLDGDEQSRPEGWSQKDGQITVTLSRRVWLARIRVEGRPRLVRAFDLSAGDLDAPDVVLPPGVEVTLQGAWPLGTSHTVAVMQTETALDSAYLAGQGSQSLRLLPGTYVLRVRDGDTVLHEQPLEVGASPVTATVGLH